MRLNGLLAMEASPFYCKRIILLFDSKRELAMRDTRDSQCGLEALGQRLKSELELLFAAEVCGIEFLLLQII